MAASALTRLTPEGETSNKFEVMYNLPISDRVAVRAVAYRDDQGGWVDNVPGTLTVRKRASVTQVMYEQMVHPFLSLEQV